MTSPNLSSIMVVGSANSDVTYRMEYFPRAGETVLATARHDAPGGKGANQAVAIATLGLPVSFIFCVGEDEQGTEIIDALSKQSVNTNYVSKASSHRTGSALILVDKDGENSIVVHPGANAFLTPDAVDAAMAELKPDFILAQLEVPIETVIATAKACVGTFVLNPAPIPRELSALQIELLLRYCDILIPNRAELASLADMPIPQTLDEIRECAKKLEFSGTLVVTLGADGALIFPDSPQGESIHMPAPKVGARDTSGAGDAFCASLVSALYVGFTLLDAVQRACEFASWSTTQVGAQVSTSHGFTLSKV